MFSHPAAALATRLYSAAPLLYIGLLMAIDPDSITKLSRMVQHGLHRFAHQLRGYFGQQLFTEHELSDLSRPGRIVTRLAGAALAGCAILYIASGA